MSRSRTLHVLLTVSALLAGMLPLTALSIVASSAQSALAAPQQLVLGEPSPTPLDLADGGSVNSVSKADLNGDGDLDVVATGDHRNPNNTFRSVVWTMIGRGDGTFDPPAEVEVPGSTTSHTRNVVTADFTGDAVPDVLVSSYESGELYLYAGLGDGTLGVPTLVSTLDQPTVIRAADLSDTGRFDVVVTGYSGSLTILRGNGDGSFGAPTTFIAAGANSLTVAIGNFTGHPAAPDIVVGQFGPGGFGNNLWLYANDGTGNIAAPIATSTQMQILGMRSGDFNGDGRLDLVALGVGDCNDAENGCSLFLAGTGAGAFSTPLPQQKVGLLVQSGTDDIDPAGPLFGGPNPDVVFSSATTLGAVLVGRGDGAGGFTWTKWAAGYGNGNSIGDFAISTPVVGAFSGGATSDILIGRNRPRPIDMVGRGEYSGGLAILHEDSTARGTFDAPSLFGGVAAGGAAVAAFGDFRGTGTPDLLVEQSNGNAALLPGTGDGRYGEAINDVAILNCGTVSDLLTPDFDADGTLDVICGGGRASFGVGDGRFGDAVDMPVPHPGWAWKRFVAADMNADGHPDLVGMATNICCPIGEPWVAELDVFLYDTANPRTFLAPVAHVLGQLGNNPGFSLVVGDLSGTGDIDVVVQTAVVNSAPTLLRIYPGNGDGTLGAPIDTPSPNGSFQDAHLVDLDSDGALDLVGTIYTQIFVALGNGDRTFGATETLSNGGNGSGPMTIADLNGDGHPDIVAVDGRCCFPQSPHVLLGVGDGTFSEPRPVTTGAAGAQRAVAAVLRPGALPDLLFINTNRVTPYTVVENFTDPGVGLAPELTITGVVSPSSVTAGTPATVEFDVTNEGGAVSSGQWTDAVYLSTSPTWTSAAKPVSVATHSAPLAHNATYHVSVAVPTTPQVDGAHYIIIRTDANDVVSPAFHAGRTESTPLAITIASLAIGSPVADTLAAKGRRFVKVVVPADTDLAVVVATGDADAADVFASSTGIPSAANFELQARGAGTQRRLVLPSRPAATTWYFTAVGRDPAATSITWTASLPALGIDVLSPTTIGADGRSTVTIVGAKFGQDSVISLMSGSTVVHPLSFERQSSTTMIATFALTDFPLGDAAVSVTSAGNTVSSIPVHVVEVEAGDFDLSTTVTPGQLRVGDTAQFTMTLKNNGDVDILMPMLRLLYDIIPVRLAGAVGTRDDNDNGPEPRIPPVLQGGVLFAHRFSVDGVSQPPGVIPPHTSIVFTQRVPAPPLPPHTTAHAYATAWTSDDKGPIDSQINLASFRPLGMSDASWSKIVDRFTLQNGSNMSELSGSLLAAVDEAAAVGVEIDDENDAVEFLVDRALDATPGAPVTGTVTQNGVPLRGTHLDVVDPESGLLYPATTWVDGSFAVWDVPAGHYEVIVDGRIPRPAAEIDVDPVGGAHDIGIAVTDGRSLSGVVATGSGTPVAGAVVSATDAAGELSSIITDGSGTYSIAGLDDGDVQVGVAAAGFVPVADATITLSGNTSHNFAMVPGIGVSGLVTGLDGDPAADVAVTAASVDGTVTGSAVTAADGTFTIGSLSGGDYRLTASNGIDAVASGVPATASASPTPVTIQLVAGAMVSGSVVDDESGLPVAGAIVSTDAVGFVGQSGQSGADGTFRLGPLPAGPQQLSVSVDQEHYAVPAPVQRTLVAGVTTLVPVRLGSQGVLNITAKTPSGALLDGQVIVVTGPNPLDDGLTDEWLTVATNSSGVATLTHRLPGTYTISAQGSAEQTVVFAAGAGSANATLVVHISTVTGRVVDATGQPVANAFVRISDASGIAATRYTDPDGRFRARANRAGTYTVQASAYGFGISAAQSFDVQIDRPTDIGDLVPGTATLSLQVSDGTDAIPGALVEAELGGAPGAPAVTVAADGSGIATIAGLAPGSYSVTAKDGVHAARRISVVVRGGTQSVPVVLGAGFSLHGFVRDPGGSPVAAAVVRAVAANGIVVGTLSGSDGGYSLSGLPASTYSVSVADFRRTPALVTGVVVPASGGATSADVVVGGAGQSISIGIGDPASDATVVISDSAGQAVAVAGGYHDDAAGRMIVDVSTPLVDGNYRAEVTASGRVADVGFSVDGGSASGSALREESPDPTIEDWFVIDERPFDSDAPSQSLVGQGADEILQSWLGNKPTAPNGEVTRPFREKILKEIAELAKLTDCPSALAELPRARLLVQRTNDKLAQWYDAVRQFKRDRITNGVILGAAANKVVADLVPLFQEVKALQAMMAGLKDVLGGLTGLPSAVASFLSDIEQGAYSQLDTKDGYVKAGLSVDSLNLVLAGIAAKLANSESLSKRGVDLLGKITGVISLGLDTRSLLAENETVANSIRGSRLTAADQEDEYHKAVAALYAQMHKAKVAAGNCPEGKKRKRAVPGFSHSASAMWESVGPGDPNDIIGPAGAGAARWLTDSADLGYIVHFENIPAATAPAVAVTVTTTLPAEIDLDTFELGELGFGDITVAVPPGRQSFHERLDLRSTIGDYVDVDAALDRSSRVVTWTLVTIDPDSGLPELGATAGFLPPNDADGRGEGRVTFNATALPGLATATTIDARASIVFDDLDAIATPVWTNTIDVDPPDAAIDALTPTTPTSDIPVAWSAGDAGSGVATYDVFASTDGGSLQPWLVGTTDTSADFVGVAGHTYGFAVAATDVAGNVEADPLLAEQITTVGGHVPPVASFDVTPGSSGSLSIGVDGASSAADTPFVLTDYDWDFGDGSPVAHGVAPSHVYAHHGTFTVTLTVTDDHAATAQTQTAITLVAAPRAVGDLASGVAAQAIHRPAPGVLGNDQPGGIGDTLTAVIDVPAQHGTVTLHADGGYDYESEPGFAGIDTFTYRAVDQTGAASPPVVVRLTISIAPSLRSLRPASPAVIGVAYSHAFGVSGFPAPMVAVGSGSLPPGLTLDPASGLLSGTPTRLGSFAFAISATNEVGSAAVSGNIIIVVTPAPVDPDVVALPPTVPDVVTPPPTNPDVVPAGASAYAPVTPARLLDTRSGAGTAAAAGSVTTVHVLGEAGVPSAGVSAVVVNLTATDGDGAGFITVYPSGATRPLASNLNVERAGSTVANLVTVPVGADGNIVIYTQTTTHLVLDIEGFYRGVAGPATAGRLIPMTPSRLLDTRVAGAPVTGGDTYVLDVAAGLPAGADPSAVVLTVVSTESTAPGYVTVYPSGVARPLASNLNVSRAGQTVSNLVTVAVGANGTVSLFVQRDSHLVVDITGWYTGGSAAEAVHGLFVPVTGTRVLDTRTTSSSPLDARTTTIVTTAFVDAGALALNVTATETLRAGFVSAWPTGIARPLASVLNVDHADQTVAGAVVVSTSAGDGGVNLYTQSGTHFVIDVNGWFVR